MNTYFDYYAPKVCKAMIPLLCITILAFAPACGKRKDKTQKKDLNTMIEIDNEVEIEEDDEKKPHFKKTIVKF